MINASRYPLSQIENMISYDHSNKKRVSIASIYSQADYTVSLVSKASGVITINSPLFTKSIILYMKAINDPSPMHSYISFDNNTLQQGVKVQVTLNLRDEFDNVIEGQDFIDASLV